jgi:hypothetical protein
MSLIMYELSMSTHQLKRPTEVGRFNNLQRDYFFFLLSAAGAAAAGASASALGATTETNTGLFFPWITAVTPFGKTMSLACKE